MGAQEFGNYSTGVSANAAFKSVVEKAEYDHGHRGYTGSIAEKDAFVMMGTADTKQLAAEMAQKFMDEGDGRIDDKWGPAGCIEIKSNDKIREYLFFGTASS